MILLGTTRGGVVPVTSVLEFLVHRREPRPDERYPGCEIVASLSNERPGLFRTIARWDDHEAVDEAHAALLELGALITDPANTGILQWDGAEWCWVQFEDPDLVAEGERPDPPVPSPDA